MNSQDRRDLADELERVADRFDQHGKLGSDCDAITMRRAATALRASEVTEAMSLEQARAAVKEVCENQWGALIDAPVSSKIRGLDLSIYLELDGYFYADDLHKLANILDRAALASKQSPAE